MLKKIILVFLLHFFAIKSFAREQFLIVPKCMLSQKVQYETLHESDEVAFIKTAHMKDFQTLRLMNPPDCRGFINTTEDWQHTPAPKDPAIFLQRYLLETHPSDFTQSYKIQYEDKVKALFKTANINLMSAHLKRLTEFKDRYVNSTSGRRAAAWLKKTLENMVSASGRRDLAIITLPTQDRLQPSIIFKLGKDLTTNGVVIGAHLDTPESIEEQKPGADDNGSGVVTVLEAARVLVNQKETFKKPIYFIWYAGSEEGLLGSQNVIAYFNQNHLGIDDVLNLDQAGFEGPDLGIGLTDDFTDAGLTAYLADLISRYISLPVSAVRCGYACSDHAVWYRQGVRVAYPFATTNDDGNPYVHSKEDTLNHISINHVMDFVKLSIAFAVELAEPADQVPT